MKCKRGSIVYYSMLSYCIMLPKDLLSHLYTPWSILPMNSLVSIEMKEVKNNVTKSVRYYQSLF